MTKSFAISLLLLFVVPTALSSAKQAPNAHIETTGTETLWTGKFAHCDYGFYVLLPNGMVAHANLPPTPLHGFLVALPETGTRQQVTTDRHRFIWTNAEYDASDTASPAEAIAQYIAQVGAAKPNRRATQHQARLGTLPATRVHVEYDGPAGRVVEETVVALRRNIVYEIGLRTMAANYGADKRQFEGVVAGFHVWRIHYY